MMPYGIDDGTGGSLTTQSLRPYPGQYYDSGYGYAYNINRDYYTFWGRYLEPDPLGLAGGLNPYLYANANPWKFTDRLGLDGSDFMGGSYDIGRSNSLLRMTQSERQTFRENMSLTDNERDALADYFDQTASAANYASLGFLAIPGVEGGFPIMQGVGYCAKQLNYLVKPRPVEQGIDQGKDSYAALKDWDKQWSALQALWPIIKAAFSVHDAR